MKLTPAMVAEAPISQKERAQLLRCEQWIANAERGFWDIGKGLHEIHSEKLYRPATWEKYCLARWDRPHDWAEQHIRAAGVMDNLHTRKTHAKLRDLALPANISQALALATLDADQQWEVWQDFHKRKEIPSVARISKLVEKLTGKPPDADVGEISEDLADELQYLPPAERLKVLKDAEEEGDEEPSRSRVRNESGKAAWLASVLSHAAKINTLIAKAPAEWEGDADEAAKRLKKLTECFEG